MRNIIKSGFIWGGTLLSLVCNAQIQAPLGSLPMQFNSSFAGEAGVPRLSLNSFYERQRIPSLNNFLKYGSELSYDQFIPAIGSGVGLTFGGYKYFREDAPNESRSKYEDYYVSLAFAPKITIKGKKGIKGKYTLSPSVSVKYLGLNYLNEKPLVSADTHRKEGVETHFGLLWNTPKYYIGYSISGFSHLKYDGNAIVNNIVTPVVNYKLPHLFFSYLQAGYTFQKNSESNFSVTPQLLFIILLNPSDHNVDFFFYRSLAYNLNFRYKKFIWGINNAGIHVGLQTERLRVMMTNDNGFISYSWIRFGSYEEGRYIGNLSLRYLFKDPSR